MSGQWIDPQCSVRRKTVLFTAAAWAEVLLTLDRGDFGALMGTGFYGLDILTPGDFLERERAAGRLK